MPKSNSAHRITIIGAGNVGHHLAHRLAEKGFSICQIFSRTLSKAQKLAVAVGADPINDWRNLDTEADIYLIAIKDDGIAEVADRLSGLIPDKLVAHTSGATPSTVFAGRFANYGIFYPLQTFSIGHPADFETIPFCIDGNNEAAKLTLNNLAKAIAPNVYAIDDEQRQILHVAAVFVNNFANYLFTIGEGICEAEKLDFEILKPLINETVRKIAKRPAAELQTGPAARGDGQTIGRHLQYLEKFPDYQQVYRLLTEKIKANH